MQRQNSTTVQPADAISRLDAFLNTQIIDGPPEFQRRWWNVKCAAKRHLDGLPVAEANATAAHLLHQIVCGGDQR